MNINLLLPHVWIQLAAALVSLWVAWAAWQRQGVRGARFLAFSMLSSGVWTLAAGIEAALVEPSAKILFSKIAYIGFTPTAVFMLMFVFSYSGQVKLRGRLDYAALWFIPITTLILAWTNDLHGLIWSGFSPGPQEQNVLVYHHGPGFWVHTVYLYGVGVAINVTLVRMYRKAARAYRAQILMMAIASFFPAVAGLIYAFELNPIQGLDWTPVSMVGAGGAFALGIARMNLLDLVPVARETLIEQIQAGIIVLDRQNRVADINPAARVLFGLFPGTEVGKPADAVFPPEIVALNSDGMIELCLGGYDPRQVEVRTTNLYEASGERSGKLIMLYDITARKNTERELQEANIRLQAQVTEIQLLKEKLREESIRDPLTGLYNRRYLDEMLEREIARSNRQKKPVSFMLMDADNFKHINDEYGHQCGDVVLNEVARIIMLNTRREDIACRFGGDEFLIILPGTSATIAFERAEGLRQKIAAKRITVREKVVSATFSVGVATYPKHGSSIDTIIRACDQALYLAKANGSNRTEAFTP